MSDHVARSLEEFTAACAARTPTPGGGAASALFAAIGAALGEMAARFTIGKKGFEAHEPALAAARDALESARAALLPLVDEDCAAYELVTAAFKLPKETDDEKAARREAIQSGMRTAMDAPLRGMRDCARAIDAIAGVAAHVNPNLVSDAGVGALALFAAIEGLAMNVRINAASLKDEGAAAAAVEEARTLRRAAAEARDRVLAAVDGALDG